MRPEHLPRRRRAVPDHLWREARRMYEEGEYSQAEIAGWLRAKGFPVTQARVSQKSSQEGWIKGSVLARLQAEAHEAVAARVGDEMRRRLEKWANQAEYVMAEATRHMLEARNRRRDDPEYLMPVMTLKTISSCYKEAQELEARAIGWDLREGAPFGADKLEDDARAQQAQKVEISEMTAAEVEQIRSRQEAEYAGEGFAGAGEGE